MEKQMRHLCFEEKQDILSSFPNIKLCYDNMNHNKVEKSLKNINYDLCCAIPCGKKCFSWFTQFNGKSVCLILELIDKKHIDDIKIYSCVFNNELIYGKHGTIFYGTLFHYKQNPFFAIEDLFYYKGNDLSGDNWFNRVTILKNLFDNDIKQLAYNKNFLVFGLPLMARDTNDLKKMIDDVQYKIYNVQFRSFDNEHRLESVLVREMDSVVKTMAIQPSLQAPLPVPVHAPVHVLDKLPKYTAPTIKTQPKNIIFKMKADIQNDIYHLYCMENSVEVFYNIAYIPDYRTSVMMNKLFRNIKENENLDLLEESDDEEEFQNENIDRFVDMNKTVYMICKFNYKFKKWYPVKEVITLKQDIVDKNELLDHEKNNYVQQQYQNKKYIQKHTQKYSQPQNKKQFYSNKPSYRK